MMGTFTLGPHPVPPADAPNLERSSAEVVETTSKEDTSPVAAGLFSVVSDFSSALQRPAAFQHEQQECGGSVSAGEAGKHNPRWTLLPGCAGILDVRPRSPARDEATARSPNTHRTVRELIEATTPVESSMLHGTTAAAGGAKDSGGEKRPATGAEEGSSSRKHVEPIFKTSREPGSQPVSKPENYPFTRRIPLGEFRPPSSRWAELPPRHLRLFLVCATDEQLAEARELFCGLKHPWKVDVLVEERVCVETGNARIVADRLVTTSCEVEVEGGLGHGKNLKQRRVIEEEGSPHWVLWRPNPALERFASLVNRAFPVETAREAEDMISPREPLTAVDLGCGSGRDTVFLAKMFSSRTTATAQHEPHRPLFSRVLGIDSVARAIGRAHAFAKGHGVEARTEFRVANVLALGGEGGERRENPQDAAEREQQKQQMTTRKYYKQRFDMAVVSRTALPRDRIRETVDRFLKPGGCIVYHHFLEGCTHPSEGLLKRDELRSLFEDEYEIIVDEAMHDPVDGRPLSVFIARRRCPCPRQYYEEEEEERDEII